LQLLAYKLKPKHIRGEKEMGYTFVRGKTKQGIIDYILGEYNQGSTHKILAHSLKGNVLYTVGQCMWTHLEKGIDKEMVRSITIWLLEPSKVDGILSWGFKDLNEVEEPFYYDCPLTFLAMAGERVPNAYESARRWRTDVEQGHTNRAAMNKAKRDLVKQGFTKAQATEIVHNAVKQIKENATQKAETK
jgi:hypothetical protein